MAYSYVQKNKIVIDELNKIRITNPEIFELSHTFKVESEDFIKYLNKFKNLVEETREAVTKIGEIADKEQLKALICQNDLQNQKQNNYQNCLKNEKLKTLVCQKEAELERLKVELQSYKDIQTQQQEYMQKIRLTHFAL